MALVKNEYCYVCAAHKQHVNGQCIGCKAREHRQALEAWKAQTTEEKLLDLHRRLLRLEAGPPKY